MKCTIAQRPSYSSKCITHLWGNRWIKYWANLCFCTEIRSCAQWGDIWDDNVMTFILTASFSSVHWSIQNYIFELPGSATQPGKPEQIKHWNCGSTSVGSAWWEVPQIRTIKKKKKNHHVPLHISTEANTKRILWRFWCAVIPNVPSCMEQN